MPTSRQLHRIATRPVDYVRFATTGRLPQGVRPEGPLVTLLKALSPRDLASLRGVTVNARLGYTGSRQFHTGAQALRWVAPADEVFDTFPANSWRDKRFTKRLYLDDLLACCAGAPTDMLARYPALRRPTPPSPAAAVPGENGTT